jgi:hypothetical protein
MEMYKPFHYYLKKTCILKHILQIPGLNEPINALMLIICKFQELQYNITRFISSC